MTARSAAADRQDRHNTKLAETKAKADAIDDVADAARNRVETLLREARERGNR